MDDASTKSSFFSNEMGDVRIWVDEGMISLIKNPTLSDEVMKIFVSDAIKEAGWRTENSMYQALLSKGVKMFQHIQQNPDTELPSIAKCREDQATVRIGIYPKNQFDWLVDRFHELDDSVAEMRKKQKTDGSLVGSYILAHSNLLEKWATRTMADHLEKSTTIQTSYKPKYSNGDIDGVVSGKHDGKDIIVFIEVKQNLDSGADRSKAVDQMQRNLSLWYDLCNPSENEIDTNDSNFQEDYDQLQVQKCKNYEVWCAFGAYKFSDQSIESKIFKKIKNPSFYLRKIKDEHMEILTK